jgi:ATP-binding cassette subfamily B protein
VLLIAHRLPTVLQAGQVILLADGCVEESGAPQTLLEQGGPFARLAAAYSGLEGGQK